MRLDTTSGRVEDFIVNDTPGQTSRHSGGGLEHPSDVTFGPDGNMYIADWGIARVSEKGLVLEEDSGVVWRVRPGRAGRGFPGGISLLYALVGTLVLAAVTVVVGGIGPFAAFGPRGPARSLRPLEAPSPARWRGW